MKNLLLAIVSCCFLLVACTIDKTDLMKAEQFCEDKLGVKKIVNEINYIYVHCMDGTSININKVTIGETR